MVLTLYESKSLNKNSSSIKVSKTELENLLKQKIRVDRYYTQPHFNHPESGDFGDCGNRGDSGEYGNTGESDLD